MSKVINLRTHRKQAARADKRREGDAQAARHGRSKGERAAQAANAEKARAHLDGHQRVTQKEGPAPSCPPASPEGSADPST